MQSSGCLIPQQLEKKRKGAKRRFLKFAYNTTPEIVEKKLLAQRNLCAICALPFETGRRPNVDHIEGTVIVRGILCNDCNLMIGRAHDNPQILRRGADYVELYQ